MYLNCNNDIHLDIIQYTFEYIIVMYDLLNNKGNTDTKQTKITQLFLPSKSTNTTNLLNQAHSCSKISGTFISILIFKVKSTDKFPNLRSTPHQLITLLEQPSVVPIVGCHTDRVLWRESKIRKFPKPLIIVSTSKSIVNNINIITTERMQPTEIRKLASVFPCVIGDFQDGSEPLDSDPISPCSLIYANTSKAPVLAVPPVWVRHLHLHVHHILVRVSRLYMTPQNPLVGFKTRTTMK